MLKVKVRWSGFVGSPGWSNFYFDTGTDEFHTPEQAGIAHGRVRNFFEAVKTKFPSAATFTVQPDIDVIAQTTGEMTNVLSAASVPPIQPGGTPAPYSAASGAVITWRTAGVRNGRRVRGRTFLVPVANGVYENDGTISPTVLNETVTAATAMVAPAAVLKQGVWARPTAPGATDGQWYPITTVSVPDMAAVLRSRRD